MLLIILIAAHFFADFTLQPSALADRKTEKIKYLLLHVAIHAVVMAVVCFVCVQPGLAAPAWGIIVLSHLVIDWLRVRIDRRWGSSSARFRSFIIDQALHLSIICGVYFGFDLSGSVTPLLASAIASDTVRQYIVSFAIFIIIWDPASVFIKMLFFWLDGAEGKAPRHEEPNAGSIIGKVERLLISVMVVLNQLSGIGFVLTAKSLARFKQLEEKDFAEKYLVGTLASASIAIIVSLALRKYI